MNGQYRVLILSVSAGTGHLRAAEALEKTARTHPEVGEVMHVDALQHTNKVFRRFYGQFYIDLVKSAPVVLGWFYNSQDEPWKTEKMRLMLDRMNTGPLVRKIKNFKPDITICTHFLPAEILSHLMKREKIETHLALTITDYHAHAMWLSRVVHHYFVGNEESKMQLQAIGYPPEAVTLSGIPIDPVFAEQRDRDELRRQYGIRRDLPLLLVSAGALGVSSAERIVEVLNTVTSSIQVVVICGKNEKLRQTILSQVEGCPAACAQCSCSTPGQRFSIRVLGYTNEMHDWMKLSDLYIGKPGGLTTVEALSCGLPMVIYQPIPGQEERNSDFLLENGAAVKCNNLATMAYKIDMLLKNPERMAKMRRRAAALGYPNAASTIIQKLVDEYNTGEAIRILRPRKRDEMKKKINSIKEKIKND
ncbi:MGDG synthase family glycosyltransferase [Tichowtungia aerotolerans]|uniref:Glycosyltransferase n=1 Tax=Tichowtungia aerotolerans TaxID=2697043 RepID=A0A6P1M7E5_9BACT|nr:glycosyltransferase [Tichowtungia aerotolerans]QHI68963.1 glycosyltransferase [Tichowtungia aerotolerans]